MVMQPSPFYTKAAWTDEPAVHLVGVGEKKGEQEEEEEEKKREEEEN